MTVAVLGPGAVGGVLAVCLLQAGVRVICIARPDTADVIRSQGLSLRRGSEVQTARPEAETALDEPVELLLVTVKAPALDDALDRVQAPVETVVPLLNGVEHMEALRGRLSDSRVVAGSIGWIEAYLERPGVVVNVDDRPHVVSRRDLWKAAIVNFVKTVWFRLALGCERRRCVIERAERLDRSIVAVAG